MRQLRSDMPTFWRLTASRASGQSMEAFYTVYTALLAAKMRRADFLDNIVDINNLVESYTHEVLDYTIYNFNDTRFTILSTAVQDEFRAVFNYWDATLVMHVPDVRQVQHMTDSLYMSALTMALNNDYARQNYGEFQFFTDIFAIDSTLPVKEETLYGPVSGTQLICNSTTLYFLDVEVAENWFYKRLGIMLGLPQETAPDIVLALYRIRIDGMGYKALDAYFQACNGIPIARKDEYVVSVSGNVVTTESHTYTLPFGQEIRVRAGQRVYVGDPFIYSIYMVDSNILPKWWLYDPFQMSTIPALMYGYTEQATWGLPVTIDALTSPFWFGFPNLPLYLMDYYVGGDPLLSELTFTGTGLNNMLLFPNYIKFLPLTGADLTVVIDGTGGSADTFTWSLDGGVTWGAAGVSMTGQEQVLRDGVSVLFKTTTGHVLADQWVTHIDANWSALPGIYVSSWQGYTNLVYYASADLTRDFLTLGVKRGDFIYMLHVNLGVETLYRAVVLDVVDCRTVTLSPVVDPAAPEGGPEQFLAWPPNGDVYIKLFRTYDGNMYDSVYQIRFTPIDNVMEVLDKHYVRVFADTSLINETDMVNTWLPLLKPSVPLWTYIEYNYVDNIIPYKEALQNEGII